MFCCPHCRFPLAGGRVNEERQAEAIQLDISCAHCKAILRISITTLKQPDPEAVKQKNLSGPSTTYCPKCQETLIVGKEDKHECKFYRPNKSAEATTEALYGANAVDENCPHGHHVNDPIKYPGLSGNCAICRGQMK